MLILKIFIFLLVRQEVLAKSVKNSDYRIRLSGETKEVDRHFLSLAIGAGSFNKTQKRFPFDFSSAKLQNILKALRKSYVRVGGTKADFVRFVPGIPKVSNDSSSERDSDKRSDLTEEQKKLRDAHRQKKKDEHGAYHMYDMPLSSFDDIYKLVNDAGSDLIWDINFFFRKGSNYDWDTANFELLLNYIKDKNYKVTWQLGNEVNKYSKFKHNPILNFQGKTKFPGVTDVANGYVKLREILDTHDREDTIIGPELTQPKENGKVLEYLKEFLSVPGVTDALDVVTFHHYYQDGKLTNVKELLDPNNLDSLTDKIKDMVAASAPKDVWISETGSAWGGGAPGISDRYAAGFLLLDKLGLSAINGIKVVIRQAFLSGNYAMINSKQRVYFPHPDFYVSALFKRLVGTKVLTTTSSSGDRKFRVYTHCSRGSSDKYSKYVTAYILNLYNSEKKFSFKWAPKEKVDQFLLTPGTEDDLQSDSVKLNGEILLMDEDDVPRMKGKEVSQPITIPAQSFGFFVVKKEYPECP